MTTYGVTPTGFVLKPQDAIAESMTDSVLGTLGNDIDVAPDQPLGQVIGILAGELAPVWELAEVAYNSINRGNAEGDALANVGSLTGTLPLPESPTSVYCTASFTVPAATYVPGSLICSVLGSPTAQFANATTVVVPATVLGLPVSPTNPWICDGTANPYLLFQSLTDGPTAGNILDAANSGGSFGALSVLVPVAGWLSVADVQSPALGTLLEQDADYRVRQYQDLSAPGSSTMSAIAAAILVALQNAPRPPSIVTVQMYENTGLTADAVTGLPGKTFMAVVYDGPNPDAENNGIIAKAIWDNKPAGGASFGNTSFPITDSEGVVRTVFFSRPTAVPIYLAFNVAVSPTATSGQRIAVQGAVVAALVAASQGSPYTMYGTTITPTLDAVTTLSPNQDVVASVLRGIAQGQSGVLDVDATAFFLGTAPGPTGLLNLVIGIGQVATLAAGNIVVTPVNFHHG